jgi:hypothetical protein
MRVAWFVPSAILMVINAWAGKDHNVIVCVTNGYGGPSLVFIQRRLPIGVCS